MSAVGLKQAVHLRQNVWSHEMQLIAAGKHHGAVQLRGPDVVKRLLGKTLDGQAIGSATERFQSSR